MTPDRDLWPDAVLRYADFDEGLIDLHLPTEPNGAVVFLIHGGFWLEVWDRTHTRHQARALAELGFIVATPEYRRVGGTGGWPRTAYDVRDAYEALPAGLADLGLRHDRILTMGHSAGGHLALWLAAQELAMPPVKTLALAGVCDLGLARELDLGEGAVDALLGATDPSLADPAVLLADRPAGAVVLLHGDQDDLVPIDLSRRFVQRNPWSTLVELSGVGHFEFLNPSDPVWLTLTNVLNDRQAGPR